MKNQLIMLVHILFFIIAVAANPGLADTISNHQPVTELQGFLVTSKDDRETITPLPRNGPPAKAVPGSVLEYRITFSNPTGRPLSAASIQGVIPEGTHYLDDSARPAIPSRLEYSIDGGHNWDRAPVQRIRRNKDGQSVLTLVSPDEYTHLRWQTSAVQPGINRMFKYRVRVN